MKERRPLSRSIDEEETSSRYLHTGDARCLVLRPIRDRESICQQNVNVQQLSSVEDRAVWQQGGETHGQCLQLRLLQ